MDKSQICGISQQNARFTVVDQICQFCKSRKTKQFTALVITNIPPHFR